MKTIKKIADELGVSKTAVRNKMTDEVKTKFAETISGVIYIDEQGETIIKQAFSKNELQTDVSGVSGNQFSQVSGEFAAVIEVLQKQLEVKDKQIADQQQSIKELTASLENTTSSMKAAQALHAGTMQQRFERLPTNTTELLDQQENVTETINQKQGFLSRLFGGKR